MRLHDIISSSLLPRFAEDAEWEQNALDVFVKAVRALSFGLGAPYTRNAISALTDADLQAYFLAYGIISYYPELSRQTRENMLFELARMYRFLGTPYAITALCRYIFDESDAVEVEVKDNLAFDNDGELIDASLLDLFDIAIDAQSASIGGSAGDRIVANVLKIARNSQALRNIYFRYEDELSIPVRCADYIGFAYRIGDDYELSRPTGSADQTLELLLGMRSSGSGANGWISVTYSAGAGYWAGIRNAKDLYAAESFGLQVHSNKWEGNIGGILMDYTYGVELLDVYSDMNGESSVIKGDGWDFEAGHATGIKLIYLAITNTIGFSTSVMSYKARFTKHDSVDVTVYFNLSHTAITLWMPGNAQTLYWGYDPYLYYDNGKKYSVMGLYNGDEVVSNTVRLTTGRNTANNSHYTYLRMENASGTEINRVTHAVIRIENVIEREAWFNANKTNKKVSAVQNVYNTYGLTFNENFERVLEIVRFEDENGNTVSADVSIYSLKEATSSLLQFYRASGSATFTAAKIVYRSLPTTKRAWLRKNHAGQNLAALTSYYLNDDDGNRILYNGQVTVGSLENILDVYSSNGQPLVDRSFLIFQYYTRDGIEYLVLTNNSSQVIEDVAFVIYKEK